MSEATEAAMKINPQRAEQLIENLSQVSRSIQSATKQGRDVNIACPPLLIRQLC